ncbi:ERV/ALR sulfhydryl oxidase domain [Pseudocohnilembus persalinus]|uniref:Sulfhydryl oxidase n=1 Tax=Pseudocohnilembus persalinus TaxID=266149 RepID=A0A0V0QT14_PSEPJ|nr:ERV/ALR sulfhydryl oxidase domain [Pseudocohnilembus persalinus]|eukprot:KRX05361.1 ERV/ALR sulfhydryl oxidase domain [Pseudocohnilembus persalinus]
MNKSTAAIISVLIFSVFLFLVNTLNFYVNSGSIKGLTGNNKSIKNLLTYKVEDIWLNNKQDEGLGEQEENDNSQSHMTRSELGQHGWSLLHMIAVTFPDTVDDQFIMKTNVFLNLFGQFYPCKECSEHFLKNLENNPFQGRTKQEFKIYVCELHNEVNQRLGKPIVDCKNEIDQLWGKSCGCDDLNEQI